MRCALLVASTLLIASPSPAAAGGAPSPVADSTREAELRLAGELEQELRSLLSAWFPRCVDRDRGGFHERFGAVWEPRPDSSKFLVYQARMTWVASAAAEALPEERERWIAIARHGGWHGSVDRQGRVLGSGEPAPEEREEEVGIGAPGTGASPATARFPRPRATHSSVSRSPGGSLRYPGRTRRPMRAS